MTQAEWERAAGTMRAALGGQDAPRRFDQREYDGVRAAVTGAPKPGPALAQKKYGQMYDAFTSPVARVPVRDSAYGDVGAAFDGRPNKSVSDETYARMGHAFGVAGSRAPEPSRERKPGDLSERDHKKNPGDLTALRDRSGGRTATTLVEDKGDLAARKAQLVQERVEKAGRRDQMIDAHEGLRRFSISITKEWRAALLDVAEERWPELLDDMENAFRRADAGHRPEQP